MNKTKIEWTDFSWPVVNGCRRISPGCGAGRGVGGCYAERLAATRLAHTAKYKGLAVMKDGGPRWTGESRLWLPDLVSPLKLRKPSRIFVADMGDLFYEGVSNEDIAAVFGVMAKAHWHTFQVLTKRAARMREWFAWAAGGRHVWPEAQRHPFPKWAITGEAPPSAWPLRNVWLGVSVENQECADERIPHLLATPAAVRFLSVEPMLGPVVFRDEWIRQPCDVCAYDALHQGFHATQIAKVRDVIDWCIVGGESGPGARAMDLAWPRAVVKQCKAAGVPAFVKQLGAVPVERMDTMLPGYGDHIDLSAGDTHRLPGWTLIRTQEKSWHQRHLDLASKKGGDMSEWPEDLRVREFPVTR